MKIKTLFFLGLFSSYYSIFGQLILTRATHEPKIGDINKHWISDSTSVIPKMSGTNQLWDFSQIVKSPTIQTTSYLPVSTTTSNIYFPTADFCADINGEAFEFYKSASTPTNEFEFIGVIDINDYRLTFSNPVIKMPWPFAYGNSYNGTFSASISGSDSGTTTGTESIKSLGTGTLILPGGIIFNNVLQVVSTMSIYINEPLPTAYSTTNTLTEYNYYSAGQKFPLITISYQTFSGDGGHYKAVNIFVGDNLSNVSGINKLLSENKMPFSFPNPAFDKIGIQTDVFGKSSEQIEIYNSSGQIVKSINLSACCDSVYYISTEGLGKGTYELILFSGGRTISNKILIE